MELKYPVMIFYSHDDGGYIAAAVDLRGCSAFGETPELALQGVCGAIDVWLEESRKKGKKLPSPDKTTRGIKARYHKAKKIKVESKKIRKPLILDFERLK